VTNRFLIVRLIWVAGGNLKISYCQSEEENSCMAVKADPALRGDDSARLPRGSIQKLCNYCHIKLAETGEWTRSIRLNLATTG